MAKAIPAFFVFIGHYIDFFLSEAIGELVPF